jgi:hypothetical protein
MRRGGPAFLLLATVIASPLAAQTRPATGPATRPDGLRAQLDETLARGERITAETTRLLLRAFEQQEHAFLDRGDLDAAKRTAAAREAFEAHQPFDTTAMPIVARAKRDWDIVVYRTRKEAVAAYERAIAGYGKARDLPAAEALQAERDAYLREHGQGLGGLPDGLVLYFSFEPPTITRAESGSTVQDLSGSGLRGTAAHLIPIDGRVGDAIAIRGGASTLDVPDSEKLRLPLRFTVAAFVRPDGTASGTIVSKNDWNQGATNGFVLRLWNGKADFTIGAGGWLSVGGADPLAPARWHHLAGTFDGERMRLFVNGNEVASREVRGRVAASQYPLTIGTDSFDKARVFAGLIDEVTVFGRALQASEVKQLAERR